MALASGLCHSFPHHGTPAVPVGSHSLDNRRLRNAHFFILDAQMLGGVLFPHHSAVSSSKGCLMTEEEVFGTRLRRRRMALGLNQQQLATRVGMRAASVSRYERGEYSSMSFARLRQIAQALSTSTDYLLGLTNDPGPVPDRRCPGEELSLDGVTLPLVTTPPEGVTADAEYTKQ
jgi:transcriptional regulator with XRE-family HTH domain